MHLYKPLGILLRENIYKLYIKWIKTLFKCLSVKVERYNCANMNSWRSSWRTSPLRHSTRRANYHSCFASTIALQRFCRSSEVMKWLREVLLAARRGSKVHIAMCLRVLLDALVLISQVEFPPPAVTSYCKRGGFG